jgi:hypothetical protein
MSGHHATGSAGNIELPRYHVVHGLCGLERTGGFHGELTLEESRQAGSL